MMSQTSAKSSQPINAFCLVENSFPHPLNFTHLVKIIIITNICTDICTISCFDREKTYLIHKQYLFTVVKIKSSKAASGRNYVRDILTQTWWTVSIVKETRLDNHYSNILQHIQTSLQINLRLPISLKHLYLLPYLITYEDLSTQSICLLSVCIHYVKYSSVSLSVLSVCIQYVNCLLMCWIHLVL